MYQANHKGDEAATSIPYQKVEGCVVQKEGVIVIHFRPKFQAQIGTKKKPIGEWEVKLKDPMQVPSNPTTAPACIGCILLLLLLLR